ncbi:hypothetical protein BJV78DRAFT_1246373 [Lactifluus subvellereus]|nr:hypothetical protein BJV78DRAFT_1246373 [Lactifluus subvellereus]
MRIFGVGRLVLGLLLPSLLVLQQLTVMPQSHHVYFVRSYSKHSQRCFIFDVVLFTCKPNDRGGLGTGRGR